MFVVRRLDAYVESHLARDGEARVEVYLRRRDLRERLFQPRQVFVEVGVGAHIYDHHFELGVVLGQHERQAFFDEHVVFGKKRKNHRHRRIGVEYLRPAVVLVAGNASVDKNIVVELHAQQRQQHSCQRRSLPAVGGQEAMCQRFEEFHRIEICAKVQNNSEFKIHNS